MDHDATLQALHADLDALRTAVEQEDHAEAALIAVRHDRHLREFIETCGTQAAANGLRKLLELQRELTRDMLARRDVAAAHLRSGRQSVRAAHAYQQAGTLA
jgi:hypothetical protein